MEKRKIILDCHPGHDHRQCVISITKLIVRRKSSVAFYDLGNAIDGFFS